MRIQTIQKNQKQPNTVYTNPKIQNVQGFQGGWSWGLWKRKGGGGGREEEEAELGRAARPPMDSNGF